MSGDLKPRKLTEANVRDLPPSTGRGYVVRDTELKGFIVIVNKKSSTWAVQRDLWQGARGRRRLVRSVRHTIGRVGIMPLRVAREQALEVIRLIQQGIDPNDPPPTRELTLRQAWQDYSEALTTRKRSSRTIDDFNYNLRYFQDWADMTLAEIGANRAMVRDRHKKITKENGPYSANHAMRALRSTYNLALKVDDRLPANPVIAVIFNKEQRRRQAISAAELPSWWAKVQSLQNPIRRDVHIFLLLTGMRRRAATGARWEHMDWEKGCLFVPKPKGGEERAFFLPLSGYLIDMLQERRDENEMLFPGSPWLWPAKSRDGHVTEPKETKRGLPPPHVLRHSYASFAKAAGLGQMDIALLMNHKLPGVTGGYIQEMTLIEQLKGAQERVNQHILDIVGL